MVFCVFNYFVVGLSLCGVFRPEFCSGGGDVGLSSNFNYGCICPIVWVFALLVFLGVCVGWSGVVLKVVGVGGVVGCGF